MKLEKTVKLKTVIILVVGAVGIGYGLALNNFPFLFILYFPMVMGSALLAFIVFFAGLIWRTFPSLPIRNPRITERRLQMTVFVCFVFFLGGMIAVKQYLPGIARPARFLGIFAFFVYSGFLGWSYVRPTKKKMRAIGTIIFIALLFILGRRSAVPLRAPTRISAQALTSLPYVAWVPAGKSEVPAGVAKYDPEKSFRGLNLYCLRNFSEAYLSDMEGNIIHTWSDKNAPKAEWHHVRLCENGDLLAIVYQGMLARLDWDSRVKWTKKMHFHHDIAVAQNNDIYLLASKADVVFISGLPVPILNDYLVILSPEGELIKEIPLSKVLKREMSIHRVMEIYRELVNPLNLWYAIKPRLRQDPVFGDPSALDLVFTNAHFDVFHNNTITLAEKKIEGLCEKGDVLISAREMDLIGIVDMKKEQLIWSWGPGNLSRQHHPTLLENGNILIFDNGCSRGYSRIVELDPIQKRIVWEYKADPPDSFYSEIGGGCQRLPNGNSLITEEYRGRVFEITKTGDIVWEFYTPLNPHVAADGVKRAAIYRLMRISDPEKYPKLGKMK